MHFSINKLRKTLGRKWPENCFILRKEKSPQQQEIIFPYSLVESPMLWWKVALPTTTRVRKWPKRPDLSQKLYWPIRSAPHRWGTWSPPPTKNLWWLWPACFWWCRDVFWAGGSVVSRVGPKFPQTVCATVGLVPQWPNTGHYRPAWSRKSPETRGPRCLAGAAWI